MVINAEDELTQIREQRRIELQQQLELQAAAQAEAEIDAQAEIQKSQALDTKCNKVEKCCQYKSSRMSDTSTEHSKHPLSSVHLPSILL